VKYRSQMQGMDVEKAIAFTSAIACEVVARTKEIRAAMTKATAAEISEATARQYEKDAKRVALANDDVMTASGSKSSFYKLRAARCRAVADEIAAAMLKADRIRKKSPGLSLAMCPLAVEVWHDVVFPLAKKLDEIRAQKWQPAEAKRLGRSTRQRHKLGRMSDDWRDRIWRRMRGSKYANAVALGLLVGLRPAEVAGAEIVAAPNGQLIVSIAGAKCKKTGNGKAGHVGTGQETRIVRLDPSKLSGADLEAFRALYDLAKSQQGKKCHPCPLVDAKKLGRTFAAAMANEFPRMTAPPSFYMLRHAFAADLKASGMAPREVAMAMGHQSTASAENYGQAQASDGRSPAVASVQASEPVRSQKPKGPPPSVAARAAKAGRGARVGPRPK
jgi:integrase